MVKTNLGKLTKGKVVQIGLLLALVGFLSYQVSSVLGVDSFNRANISNLFLISIVLLWVFSYVFRVINGNMTFMEQRKRYRQVYEKKFTEKLEKKFESLSNDEQKKLLEKLDEK